MPNVAYLLFFVTYLKKLHLHGKSLQNNQLGVSQQRVKCNLYYLSNKNAIILKTVLSPLSSKVLILHGMALSYVLIYILVLTSSGEQSDFAGVDVLLPVCAGAGVPADRLAALQARGGLPVRLPLHHHSNAPLVDKCSSHAGHAVLLRGGDSQRGGLFLLHLQVLWLRGQSKAPVLPGGFISTPEDRHEILNMFFITVW